MQWPEFYTGNSSKPAERHCLGQDCPRTCAASKAVNHHAHPAGPATFERRAAHSSGVEPEASNPKAAAWETFSEWAISPEPGQPGRSGEEPEAPDHPVARANAAEASVPVEPPFRVLHRALIRNAGIQRAPILPAASGISTRRRQTEGQRPP